MRELGLGLIIFALILSGCSNGKAASADAGQSAGLKNVNLASDTQNTISENTESEDSEMPQADNVTQVKNFLMEHLRFESEDAVLGTAETLCSVGCVEAAELILLEDTDGVYVIRLKDQNGKVFLFNVSHHGTVGPIRDDQDNYLYAPIN